MTKAINKAPKSKNSTSYNPLIYNNAAERSIAGADVSSRTGADVSSRTDASRRDDTAASRRDDTAASRRDYTPASRRKNAIHPILNDEHHPRIIENIYNAVLNKYPNLDHSIILEKTIKILFNTLETALKLQHPKNKTTRVHQAILARSIRTELGKDADSNEILDILNSYNVDILQTYEKPLMKASNHKYRGGRKSKKNKSKNHRKTKRK